MSLSFGSRAICLGHIPSTHMPSAVHSGRGPEKPVVLQPPRRTTVTAQRHEKRRSFVRARQYVRVLVPTSRRETEAKVEYRHPVHSSGLTAKVCNQHHHTPTTISNMPSSTSPLSHTVAASCNILPGARAHWHLCKRYPSQPRRSPVVDNRTPTLPP